MYVGSKKKSNSKLHTNDASPLSPGASGSAVPHDDAFNGYTFKRKKVIHSSYIHTCMHSSSLLSRMW